MKHIREGFKKPSPLHRASGQTGRTTNIHLQRKTSWFKEHVSKITNRDQNRWCLTPFLLHEPLSACRAGCQLPALHARARTEGGEEAAKASVRDF